MNTKELPDKKRRDAAWSQIKGFLLLLVVIPLIPLIIVVVTIGGVYRVVRGLWLGFMVKMRWYPEGKHILFVYSNSPNWKEYIEATILPKIAAQAAVINWSDRSNWDWSQKSLEVAVFQHWTGVHKYSLKGKVKWDGAEFNPVAIVFSSWWKPKVLRFWQPFKDFKHGRQESLKKLETQFFSTLKVAG